MDMIWICDLCNEELPRGEEAQHNCFRNSTQLYQMEDSNRLTFVSSENKSDGDSNPKTHTDISEDLIMSVQNRPALYDHRLPLTQRNRQVISRLWQEVLYELRGHFNEVHEVQVRWRSLRDRFVKEFSERTSYKHSGSGADVKSKWIYYDIMLFLKDIIKPKNTTSNVSPQVRDDDRSTSESPTIVSPSNSSESNSTPSLNTKGCNKRKLNNDTVASKLIDVFKEMQHIPDDADAFSTRLAASLRRLPRRERCKLEIKILQQVYDVEEELGILD